MARIKVTYFSKQEVSSNEIILDIHNVQESVRIENDRMVFVPYEKEEMTEQEFLEELDNRGGAYEYLTYSEKHDMEDEIRDEAIDDLSITEIIELLDEKLRWGSSYKSKPALKEEYLRELKRIIEDYASRE